MTSPRTCPNASRQHAFTLVELLTVITIILVLVGLTFGAAGYVQYKQATSAAKTQIAAITSGIEAYHAEFGEYPDADTPEKLYLELTGDYNDDGTKEGPNFMRNLPEGMVNDDKFVDPWGQPYNYERPDPDDPDQTMNNPAGFDLWSTGGAGNDEAKWITNWN